MTFELVCAFMTCAVSGFTIGLLVGRAEGAKTKREFEQWRADVLADMAQEAEDARNWSKFTEHVVAMDKQAGK